MHAAAPRSGDRPLAVSWPQVRSPTRSAAANTSPSPRATRCSHMPCDSRKAAAYCGEQLMPRARVSLLVVSVGAMVLAGVLAGQDKPAAPMRVEKVRENLYVLRGPFNPCAPNGCRGGYGDDGLLHEAGDVAVRVTSEGLILVDDKYQENVADIMQLVKGISSQPIKYLLNTHHHTDHAGGDQTFVKTTEVIAHRNVRANFLKNKQP